MAKKEIVWYVTAESYADKGNGITIVKAGDIREALLKIIKEFGYDLDDQDEEDRKEVVQLWEYFDDMNGDGCDFVFSIISNKGEIIYCCDRITNFRTI